MKRLLLLIGIPLLAQPGKVAPYYTPGAGPQNVTASAATDTSIDIVNSGSMMRTLMPFSGLISQVSIPLGDVSSLVTFYPASYTCTANAASACTTWTAHYAAGITGPFVANALNTFTLSAPLAVTKLDATGGRLEFNQPHSASLNLVTAQLFPAIGGATGVKTAAETCYYQLNAAKPSTIAASGLTLIPNAGCPVIGYNTMPAPVVGTGDSIESASAPYPGDSVVEANAEVYPLPATYSPVHFWLAAYAGGTSAYHSLGWPGQTAVQVQARFTDALSLKPRYLLIAAAVNDLSGCDITAGCTGGQIATIETALASMMSAAQTAGATPVVMLIGPWNTSSGSNARHVSGDAINADIISVAPSYGAVVVDWRCLMGQFRSGGTAGNCWDFQSAYLYSDGLGIHPNQTGMGLIGALIASLVPSLSPSIGRPSSGVAW